MDGAEPRVRYLTGHAGPEVRAYADHPHLGLMAQPDSYGATEVARWQVWAADNGCFALRGAPFDHDRWMRWLAGLPRRTECLFATAPDVLHWPDGPTGDPVGDAAATLAQAPDYLATIRQLGYPAALVLQDGMTPDVVPWAQLDAVFVGGSTPWKLSPAAQAIVIEAVARGLHAHMGRVNTRNRLRRAAAWGCHTADGTTLARGARTNLPSLLRWLAELDHPQLHLA